MVILLWGTTADAFGFYIQLSSCKCGEGDGIETLSLVFELPRYMLIFIFKHCCLVLSVYNMDPDFTWGYSEAVFRFGPFTF